MRADIDNARMGTGAEDNQSQVAYMHDEHALVHQDRIWLPRGIGAGSTEMVDTTLFKGADPGYLAAVIEVPIEQQPLVGVVHDSRAVPLQFRRQGYVGSRDDRAALQADSALVKHARLNMDGDASALLDDRVDRSGQSGHVIPMSVGHRDTFDLAHRDPEIGAIACENGSFGSGIEQQNMAIAADLRHQTQSISEISAKQRLTRYRLGPGTNDVGELRYRE